MNTVVLPQMRTYVEKVVQDVYSQVNSQHNLANQRECTYKKHGSVSLEYRNINGNKSIYKTLHDNRVHSYTDFAKLFLQQYMSQFIDFCDTDLSAVISMALNIDDSQCVAPTFTLTQNVTVTKELRELRNSWAHCNLGDWTPQYFSDSFQTMENLITTINGRLDKLKSWQKLGNFVVLRDDKHMIFHL